MYHLNDAEISGGTGFGFDPYPSEFDYHTQFLLYSNGSTPLNRNPYIPIENERMGRDWNAANFDSSDPRDQTIYPYHDVYNSSWNRSGFLPERAYLQKPREQFLSNTAPTFYSADPMVGDRFEKKIIVRPEGFTMPTIQGVTSSSFIMFAILIFILAMVVAMVYNHTRILAELLNRSATSSST